VSPLAGRSASKGRCAQLRAKGYAGEPWQRTSDKDGYFIRGQATGRDQAVHTASDIPISAYSSGSQVWRSFVGVQTNTDVFFKLLQAASGNEDVN
jgi:alkaline phosphatase